MAGINGRATRDLDDLFCRLADPVAATEKVSDADIPELAKMASSHNVSTILYRKIGGARLAALAPELVAEVEGLTAMTLRLESLLPGLRAAFSSRGVDPIIVKGPVFAERLYPDPADRPFTDIDIVASPDDFDAIGEILTDLGLYQHVKDRFDRSEANQEQKWISDADPNLLIELHGDLVHYPGLRRRVRLGHGELMSLGPGSATALFLTAVAHGALGHKFHTQRLRWQAGWIREIGSLRRCFLHRRGAASNAPLGTTGQDQSGPLPVSSGGMRQMPRFTLSRSPGTRARLRTCWKGLSRI
ncbi:MAG: hypothetical protein GKR99_16135 [Rhodobacteraceae bacterium]|nr:hypothetical protein [Paracoccaceae bacterium]